MMNIVKILHLNIINKYWNQENLICYYLMSNYNSSWKYCKYKIINFHNDSYYVYSNLNLIVIISIKGNNNNYIDNIIIFYIFIILKVIFF